MHRWMETETEVVQPAQLNTRAKGMLFLCDSFFLQNLYSGMLLASGNFVI